MDERPELPDLMGNHFALYLRNQATKVILPSILE